MNLWLPVLCVFLVTSFSEACELMPSPLKIAAWNIQIFGKAKMAKPFVPGIITKVIRRYDIILIQEIRDKSGDSIQQLWDMVNRSDYNLTLSTRLGRTSSKEQYAFFTRIDKVDVLATHQYDDGEDDDVNRTDDFEREPFCVKFRHRQGSFIFALIGIHVRPLDAVKEIKNLYKVVENVTAVWPEIKNLMILGDLNADCSYLTETALHNAGAEIYDNKDFCWLVNFTADTTTKATDCAYDRFIVFGDDFRIAFFPYSAVPFDFGEEYNLSYDNMTKTSDHKPIEMTVC